MKAGVLHNPMGIIFRAYYSLNNQFSKEKLVKIIDKIFEMLFPIKAINLATF